MSALVTDDMVEAAAKAMADDWNPESAPILTAMFRDYAATALEAAAPTIAAKVLRDAAEACTVTVPDETYTVTIRAALGYKVQVAFTEDLMARADRIERGES